MCAQRLAAAQSAEPSLTKRESPGDGDFKGGNSEGKFLNSIGARKQTKTAESVWQSVSSAPPRRNILAHSPSSRLRSPACEWTAPAVMWKRAAIVWKRRAVEWTVQRYEWTDQTYEWKFQTYAGSFQTYAGRFQTYAASFQTYAGSFQT